MKRIRRDLRRFGLGMLQITSKAKTERVYASHVALIDSLIDDSQIGVLKALREKRVTLGGDTVTRGLQAPPRALD